MPGWLTELLVPVGTLFGGGVLGTLFGPSVQDRVERRREGRLRQRRLVDEWRLGIAQEHERLRREKAELFNPGASALRKISQRGALPFATTPWYSSLEPYLTEMTRDGVMRPTTAANTTQEDTLRKMKRAVERTAKRWHVE